MRYLFTHLDNAWALTVVHLRLSLIPIVLVPATCPRTLVAPLKIAVQTNTTTTTVRNLFRSMTGSLLCGPCDCGGIVSDFHHRSG